jgi:hypothetical protein
MILLYAILFICFEAISETLIKKHYPQSYIFKGWVQWVIAIGLFLIWFVIAYNFDKYYVELWKLITGFIFVRALIFNPIYNIISGLPIGYYGTTKLYDRIMFKLGSWGYFMVIVLGICGIVFLMGWS